MGFGQTIFSLMWGYIADVKGKKPTLIASASLLMFTTLAFGFTSNFDWAVTTRFMQGSSLGISLISKSIIANACDDTNMAFAMSILFSTVSVGFIIGPSVAGFLAFPSEKYPDTFPEDSVFGRFGILLPNLLLAIGFSIGIILLVLFIPNEFRNKNERTPLFESLTHSQRNSTARATENKVTKTQSSLMTLKLQEKGKVQQRGWKAWLAKIKTYKLIKLLRLKDYAQVNLVYFVSGVIALGNHELLPLFLASSAEYHGMGFSTSKIGLTLLMVSVCFLPPQLLIVPRVLRRYGSRKILIGGNLLFAFICPWTPILVNTICNRNAAWMAVVVVSFLQRTSVSAGLVSINILINNSVTPDLLGSANGFSMIFFSLGRMIAPLIVGSTYSWSLKNIRDVSSNSNPIGFPFDQHFSFYVLSLMSILNSFFASRISTGLDKKKKVSPEVNGEQECSTKI
ncbi:uncharacterized protein LOC130636535 [Hydractinia symbiolongicarpus]|uniref:uncharacterized protein LOC130636535 n=1 Tax=Hydractinia symbiolongicarpus TaxID=13093 RepID=UPI002550BF1B|nr:uncharacterized protein LOC130636535 [Hydractinia symbiolongicarpus]XP_057302265.1 uncharacterized protein LOC130636535 [Hydractinia symbiolongicarpus]